AQTVVVQQAALEEAERRIRELESQSRRLDDGRRDAPRGPWDRAQPQDDRYDRRSGGLGGGGFLAGAAPTAMGVAGGMLLGSMIGSLFGGGAAHAAEGNDSHNADNGQDHGNDAQDAGNDNDFGGFDGGDGGFDMGGDF